MNDGDKNATTARGSLEGLEGLEAPSAASLLSYFPPRLPLTRRDVSENWLNQLKTSQESSESTRFYRNLVNNQSLAQE